MKSVVFSKVNGKQKYLCVPTVWTRSKTQARWIEQAFLVAGSGHMSECQNDVVLALACGVGRQPTERELNQMDRVIDVGVMLADIGLSRQTGHLG